MSTLSKVRAIFCAAVLAAVAWTPAALAQVQGPTVKVNIPFGFENGQQHFAPGMYTLQNEGNFLFIRGAVSGASLTTPAETREPSSSSKIVFHRYGERYFLRSVWVAGRTIHTELPKSKSEKRLQIAGNATVKDGVDVALLEVPR